MNDVSRQSAATMKPDLPRRSDAVAKAELYHIDLTTLEGVPQRMDVYRGRTLLIVNVASRCESVFST